MLSLAKVGTSLDCLPSLLSSSGVFSLLISQGHKQWLELWYNTQVLTDFVSKILSEKKYQATTKEEIVENSSFSHKCIPHFLVLHFPMVLVFCVFFRYVSEDAKHSPLLSSSRLLSVNIRCSQLSFILVSFPVILVA